ncbi:hypothetical protein ACF50P_002856, partial [Escherichia coli]
MLSQARKYILNRRTWRFFYSVFYGSLRRAFFISAPRLVHITSDSATQKVSAGAFDGVFFYGPLVAIFIDRRKSMSEPLSGSGTAAALG